MAESSNPPQSPPPNQEPNPQQQDQLERPESPISFDLATQVGFNLEDIIFNDNNEVSLLYPPHINSDYFKVWGDRAKETLKKSCLPPRVEKDFAMLIWEDFYRKLNKKTREKVVPCPWFLSILLQHKMEGYGNEELTLNPTQVFSVHNWALKKNQPEGPPFTNHMLAICNANAPVAFKALKTSSKDEKKSKIEAAKGVSSSKWDTSSQTGHLEKETHSSSAMDTNPSQPSASTPMVAEMHKEDQQAAGGPISLGVTSEERFDPQLSSAGFIAEVDLGKSDPNDSISKQQGMDKGTQNYLIDHIIAGSDPLVLIEKTKSASKGLETVLTKPVTEKEARHAKKEVSFASDEFNTSLDLTSADEISKIIKLEHLSKLVQNVEVDFIDLDSPEDDKPIIVQDESDEEVHAEKVQTEEPKETKDTTASHPPFPKTVKIQELSTQLLVLQTLNSKLVREKEAAENESA
ncbi:hypothetical protein Tco_0851809 [Tanacetum coccineum]